MKEYSFTVTLKPVMYRVKAEKQYDITCDELEQRLKSLNEKYTLVMELSKGYNVHYHGIIGLKKAVLFYDEFRDSKIFGHVYVKLIPTFEDMSNWKEYLRKDTKDNCEITNRRPIIKDDYNVFSVEDYANWGTHW